MNYFEWWGDLDAIEIHFPERHFGNWWMVEGREVSGWNEHLVATYSGDDALRSNFGISDNAWPVFSPRMRDLIATIAPGTVQFLPFRLQRPDGSGEVHGYSVGQILRVVDCFDRRRTKTKGDWEAKGSWGEFEVRRPLYLARNQIGGERLFRLQGNRGTIVVREDIRTEVEAAGFEGQRFDLLEAT